MLIRAAIFTPPTSYYAAQRGIPYFTGATWNSRWAFSRKAVSKRGSLGDMVGRGAWAKSIVAAVLGTLRRLYASSRLFGVPDWMERSIMSTVAPGTVLNESACSLALGESNASPAFALAVRVKTAAAATANRMFFFIMSFFVVRLVAAVNHILKYAARKRIPQKS